MHSETRGANIGTWTPLDSLPLGQVQWHNEGATTPCAAPRGAKLY